MHYVLISKYHWSKMRGAVSPFYRTVRRLEDSWLLQGVTPQGKGVCRAPISSEQLRRKKRQVLCEDVFKMRPQKPEGKMVEQSYVWTMMNLCPSLSCLSQKATGIKNHSWWPIGLLALMTGRCVALWSSCTNRSLWNRAGPRPVRPRHTDQSPHGATMAVACHACPVGRQMEQGSSDACNLWAQQFCLVTEWLCIEGFFFGNMS